MANEDNDLPPDLADEILSINAIYGPDTLRVHASKDTDAAILELSPPSSHPFHPATLLLSFPPQYPSVSARVLGPATSDPSLGKGAAHAAATHVQEVLQRITVPDEPVVFALLAELETTLLSDEFSPANGNANAPADSSGDQDQVTAEVSSMVFPLAPTSPHDPRFDLPLWTTAPPLESHRSVFIGRAIPVKCARDVEDATAALKEQDRHVARATHNIRAWRFRSETTRPGAGPGCIIEHQECDDDGESRAGAKVLEVMSAMGVWEVLVIVSRWYGGVKLGPERFRLIGQCARDVLVRGGWGPDKTDDKKGKKKGK